MLSGVQKESRADLSLLHNISYYEQSGFLGQGDFCARFARTTPPILLPGGLLRFTKWTGMRFIQKVGSKRRSKPGVFFAFGLSGNCGCRSRIWPGVWESAFQAWGMPWRGARPLHETRIINWLIDFLSFLRMSRFTLYRFVEADRLCVVLNSTSG